MWVRWTGNPCCSIYTPRQCTETQSQVQNQEIICASWVSSHQVKYQNCMLECLNVRDSQWSECPTSCWHQDHEWEDAAEECPGQCVSERAISLRHIGQGIVLPISILHSGTPDSHIHAAAIAINPAAVSSWEAVGNVFNPISERIIHIGLKIHMSFASIIAIYASINPVSSISEVNEPSSAFYNQLQATLSSISPKYMVIILGDFNARVGSNFNTLKSVIGLTE